MARPPATRPMSNSVDGRSVTSKLAAMLHVFTNGDAHSLSEIARCAQIPVSTAHRLASELTAWDLLERTDDKSFQVGSTLKAIGGSRLKEPSYLERGRRTLDALSAATHVPVRLGVLEGGHVRYLEKSPDRNPPPQTFQPEGLPAHATAMGKALLAFAQPDVVDQLVARGLPRYTPFTLTNPAGLRRILASIRLTRVAVSRQELDLHTCAVAAPVFTSGGRIIAAVEGLPGRRAMN